VVVVPGVLVLEGMSLQFPAGSIVIAIGDNGRTEMPPIVPHLRLDTWPTWLQIGCEHSSRAHETASRLQPSLGDPVKAEMLSSELRDSMVAMCAFAFAFDGFYDVVKSKLGEHPHAARWLQEAKRPTPRHTQVCETLRYHLKLGPQFTGQLGQLLKELFKFRGRAVHPSSSYWAATMRADVDSGVHPHLLTFSGSHALQCRAITLVLLDRLVDRATDLAEPAAERGWIETGRREVDRLAAAYRIPGDGELAYPAADVQDPGAEPGDELQ
jgi:hypothetical protein